MRQMSLRLGPHMGHSQKRHRAHAAAEGHQLEGRADKSRGEYRLRGPHSVSPAPFHSRCRFLSVSKRQSPARSESGGGRGSRERISCGGSVKQEAGKERTGRARPRRRPTCSASTARTRERVPQQKPLSAMANNTDFEQIQCLQ